MYERVVRFTDVSAERMERLAARINEADAPRTQASETNAFRTIGAASVWSLREHRFRVEAPDGEEQVEGFERARELAHTRIGRRSRKRRRKSRVRELSYYSLRMARNVKR